MKAKKSVAVASLLFLACSPDASEDDSDSRSDDSASEEDEGEEPEEEVPAPVPTGPGLDGAIADSCEVLDCTGSHIGTWTVASRCDASGTWVDVNCPSAVYAWTLLGAAGDIEFETDRAEWHVQTELAWSVQVPGTCGGCTAAPLGSDELRALDCAEDADGACACTGSSTHAQDWTGSVFNLAGDGHYRLQDDPTAAQVEAGALPLEHEFWTCATDTQLRLYDENGGRLELTRVQP